jgi:hypothetical protein
MKQEFSVGDDFADPLRTWLSMLDADPIRVALALVASRGL